MKSKKLKRIDIFRGMKVPDKLFTVLLLLVGIVLFSNGLYLVGANGVLLVIGAFVLLFIAEIFRTTEIEMITKNSDLLGRTSTSGQTPAVGAAANDNDDLIRNIIDKRKQNPQQGLLGGLGGSKTNSADAADQAKKDHEFLVEMMHKKQEEMRTAVSNGPAVDPKVKEKIIEKQKAYIHELMEPTIIPQRELAEKAAKKAKK